MNYSSSASRLATALLDPCMLLFLPVARLTPARTYQCPVARLTTYQCPMPPCCKAHRCKAPSVLYALPVARPPAWTLYGLVWSVFYTPCVSCAPYARSERTRAPWSVVWSGLCFIHNPSVPRWRPTGHSGKRLLGWTS